MAGKKKSVRKSIGKYWDWYFVLAFLVVRLLLNAVDFDVLLHLSFTVSYIVLLFLMFKVERIFGYALIAFLYVDSLIGTYLWMSDILANWDYFGIMVLYLFIILVVLYDKNKIFWRR